MARLSAVLLIKRFCYKKTIFYENIYNCDQRTLYERCDT